MCLGCFLSLPACLAKSTVTSSSLILCAYLKMYALVIRAEYVYLIFLNELLSSPFASLSVIILISFVVIELSRF